MKLRHISLTNVRRFAGQRLRIGGIGDGITVLAQPNEFGKSTVFDALHAVFFERHTSKARPVKDLQPHSGGAIEIAVGIETQTGRFLIEKRFLAKPSARITDESTGRIVAMEDEAETWIGALMGAGMSGPAGLLWVRQGDTALENAGGTKAEKDQRDADRSTRRALLSDVLGGEIDAMTGGRRMETVRDATAAALDRLATSRGAKAGGPWAEALAEAADLLSQETELDAKVAALRSDLATRARAEADKRVLDDPETRRAQAEAHAAAQAALREAEGQDARRKEAEQAVQMAMLSETSAADACTAAETAAARHADATAAHIKAQATLAQAEADAGMHEAAADQAEAARDAAEIAARTLTARLTGARRADAARRAAQEVETLRKRLTDAEAQRASLESAQARIDAAIVTPADIQAAEAAETALHRARTEAGAEAVTVRFVYAADASASIGGEALAADTDHVIPARREIDLPGFGRLTIDPGRRETQIAADAVARAEDSLAQALARCGAENVAQARAKLEARQIALSEKTTAAALLANLAPEGLPALRSVCATTQAAADAATNPENNPETTPVADLETALADAEKAAATARGVAEAKRAIAAEARASRAAARATCDATARAATAAPAPDPARLVALRAAVQTARAATATARDASAALATASTPLAVAKANADRTAAVIRQADEARTRLDQDIARLGGAITAQADLGIEERLESTVGRRQAADARAARFADETAALRRLRAALDTAQSAAREQFFAPVLAELTPLLRILHPGAQLVLDDQSLLPVGIARDGIEESLDILSGGTREQIAILTRLAFANLHDRAGQRLPIILDDALVHSDDDRIVAMFTALHLSAASQQILVLTCRQRAFAELGGHAPEVIVERA